MLRAARRPLPVLLGSIAVALCLGWSGAHAAEPAPTRPGAALDPIAVARALGDAFATVAAQVAPATVHIEVDKTRPMSTGLEQLMRDYRLPGLGQQGGATRGTSTGSGVLIAPEGLVLTNHHVVGGANAITVTLHDKRRFSARLVGSDPRTDVAVLQIDGDEPLPWVPVGDSDTLRVGEWVLAVGHPFEFEFTVTAGIVSARGRRNLARDEIQDYIQTDAAVNPGSSGGPLFNLAGEVVGINTAIFNPSKAATHAGIAFAIPVKMAMRVADELLETGRVARAAIGVTTRDRPASEGNPRPGAEVTRVLPDGPAEAAGLRRGDVIIRVGDEAVAGSEDLKGIVLASGVGTPLTLVVERGRGEQEHALRTRDGRDLGSIDLSVPEGGTEWGGLVLAPADEDRLARFGVVAPERAHPGLVVLGVAPASPGAAAGIVPGDLLLEVQREAITDLAHFESLVRGRRSAAVTLWRGGEITAVMGGLERRGD